jgi:hypothetical protein
LQQQALFNHLIGATKERERDGEAECVSRLEVNDKLDFRDLLHRQAGGFFALEDATVLMPSSRNASA